MLAHFCHHLIVALLNPLLPYIRNEFSLTYTQSGWLVFAFGLSYGLTQIPGGWLADRIGPRTILTIGVAGIAVAGLLIGISPNYVMTALFLILLGAAGGGYHPAAAPLVSASVEPGSRGRALGLHQIGGTGSFFLAPLIAAGIAGILGWRGTFIAISVPSIVFSIVFFILLGRLKYGIETGESSSVDKAKLATASGHSRRLKVIMALGIASMALGYSIISFIPLFAVDHFDGVSNEAAAAMLSLVYFSGLLAGPLGGYLSDRLGREPIVITMGLITGPAIYMLNMAPLGIGFSAVLIIIGVVVHVCMPVVEAYIISHTTERRRSTILGIYYLGSRGGLVIAPAIGYIIDHYSFYIGFSITGAIMTTVAIACTTLLLIKRS